MSNVDPREWFRFAVSAAAAATPMPVFTAGIAVQRQPEDGSERGPEDVDSWLAGLLR